MPRLIYENVVFVDTSAGIALLDADDKHHGYAVNYFSTATSLEYVSLNVTSHESYTRGRYDYGFQFAAELYDFFRSGNIASLEFSSNDETDARELLEKYSEHDLSFHDALCASVCKRTGIFRVFTFDRHFWTLGFQVVPGWIL